EQVDHQVVEAVALSVDAFDVVVVDVQLGVGGDLVRLAERVGDVVATHAAVPDRVAERTVLVERFVDHVPGVDVTPVASGHHLDVVLHDGPELAAGEAAVVQPGRQLAVPDQGVAAHNLVVGLGEVDDVVGLAPVVLAPLRLQRLPLHLVFVGDGAELGSRDVAVLGVTVERAVGDSRTEVAAAVLGSQFPQGRLGLCRGGRDQQAGGSQRRGEEEAERASGSPRRTVTGFRHRLFLSRDGCSFVARPTCPLSLSVRPHVRERSHVRPVTNLTRYVSEWKIVFIKPIRTAVTQTSSRTVNGPSLVNATDIRAPNTPVSTRAPKARNSSTTWSTRGSATGPGAAACHVGRRPLRASPYNVNWLTTNSGAPTSEHDFSSSKIRSVHSFRASLAASAGPSVWVTPTSASRPGSSIAPTTFPSTVTEAWLTRCTTARMTLLL